jgi:ABC-2 type transport system permease protein
MVFVLLIGYVFFGVAVRGSYLLLGIATLCFLFAALGMGLLISSVMKSQQEAFQIAMLSTLLPSIILSGFIFPISSMPRLIQAVTLLVPPRYLVSTMRAVILKDAPFSDVWFNLAAMLALGLVFNLVAMRRMRGER